MNDWHQILCYALIYFMFAFFGGPTLSLFKFIVNQCRLLKTNRHRTRPCDLSRKLKLWKHPHVASPVASRSVFVVESLVIL